MYNLLETVAAILSSLFYEITLFGEGQIRKSRLLFVWRKKESL